MSHSMMLLNKIIFGVETAVLIFAVGMLICYGERSFYQAMELMGLCVMVMAQSILGMKQNEAAEALKRNEDVPCTRPPEFPPPPSPLPFPLCARRRTLRAPLL